MALALQFASSVVFARYLTPYEMGIFAVATALVGILAILQQLSLPAIIVREENLTEDFTRTAFTINAALTMALSLVIVVASFVGGVALGDPGVRNVLLVLAITPLFGIVAFLPTSYMEREGRFKRFTSISLIANMVNTITGIGLVVAGFRYMSIAYAQVAGSAAFAALAVYAGRRHARYGMGLRSWRRILSFSAQMLAISGIHSVGTRLSELLLGRLLGLGALGIYNRAGSLNGLLWNNINGLVGRVMLVDFAGMNRRGEPLRDRYLQTVAVMTAVLWPAFTGLAIVAKPFIVYVYGTRWVAAVGPFALLALSSILQVAITMTWQLFTATGRLADQTRVETIRVVIGLAAFALGCMISLEAAAAARVLDALLAIYLYRPYLNEMTGTSMRDFWTIYLQSIALTFLAVVPAGVLMLASETGVPPIPALLGVILLGMALWAAGLLFFNHPLSPELKRLASLVTRRPAPTRIGSVE